MITTYSPPKEIDYFPKNGLKPGSIQYFPEGLLGHQFLKKGFQGSYIEKNEVKAKAKEFRLFLAIFKNSLEATKAIKIYRDDLSKRGKVGLGDSDQFGSNSLKGEDPYQGQIIATQKGIYLLGAIGFEKAKNGEDRLSEIMKQVK
jgi:hypothetical protein